jgi:hypothetical protein
MNSVEIPNALQLTSQEAENALKECYRHYKTTKSKADELWKEFEHKVNTN